jgi:phenylpyruvate tautomerase PptA (4-oxalocrotonate tautomerase family)
MPLYTITTQAGVLDSPAKSDLADKLTALHAGYAAVPKNWVHIVFQEYPIGSGFTAGMPSPTAALTLLIRTGRSADYKRELLKRLWSLVQAATGAPDEEIVLGIQEVPSSQAMEMGQIMPDISATHNEGV